MAVTQEIRAYAHGLGPFKREDPRGICGDSGTVEQPQWQTRRGYFQAWTFRAIFAIFWRCRGRAGYGLLEHEGLRSVN